MYKSWEGAQPGSQPKLVNGNTLYHRCHAQFINGGYLGGRDPLFFWEFELFLEFGGFCSMSLATSVKFASSAKSVKFVSSRKPLGSAIAAQGLAMQLVVEQ